MWMVRAGRQGRWAEVFLHDGAVGLGWRDLGDSSGYADKNALFAAMRLAYPEMSEGTAASGASQIWRFRKEIGIGDDVVTYDGGTRLYHIGRIAGPATFLPGDIEEMTLRRAVEWASTPVARDDLSLDARNRLGSTLTLFRVPEATAKEMRIVATGRAIPSAMAEDAGAEERADPFDTLQDTAVLRIADRIGALGWEDMERLVAALLRALGFRTEVSRFGPDRGKDIIASPDGFGFQHPRIVVEVKHRRGEKIDAPTIRSFVGGRHRDDRGLYVSTGGFSREAYYEADRATIPLKLMTLDELARAVIDSYDRFDSEGRTLLPLTRLYWPA